MCGQRSLRSSILIIFWIFIIVYFINNDFKYFFKLSFDLYKKSILVEVLNGMSMGEKKNMNLPGVEIDLPTVTEKDEEDILNFGLKKGFFFKLIFIIIIFNVEKSNIL